MSQKFVSDNSNMYGHVDTCEIHASVASEMKTLHISKRPLPQKYTSKTFSLSFLALKENEPKYIYSRNDKFVVFCSVALHYRIKRTYHYNCIYI